MDNKQMTIRDWVEISLEEYPPNLQAKHIAEFLGVGINTVYKILKDGKIPTLTIPGYKFLYVPKREFINWYVASIDYNNAD